MAGEARNVMSGPLNLDYFYGIQADQFEYYRIPKLLITDKRYNGISSDAKILYGVLLDRMSLSLKNKWIDEQGRSSVKTNVGSGSDGCTA